ncbi:MAG TPA: hypothetical protein VG367_18565 [Mucilaginibacter sp.]|jgi:hypothetical protein|nr:hypothetical protein [Mucilaginibacter sp.]
MRKRWLILAAVWFGCSHHNQTIVIKIKLDRNKHSIQISGFNKMIIDDISQDTSSEAWRSLLPVYKMPADTDMKDFQNAQPGKYKVAGNEVIFTPDTPFRKNQEYFLRTFDYSGAKNAWDFVRKQKGKGSAGHKDLLFKY